MKKMLLGVAICAVLAFCLSWSGRDLPESAIAETPTPRPSPINVASPVAVPKARQSAAPAASAAEIASFREMAEEVVASLPTGDEIEKSTKDFHYTPPLLRQSGARLGAIREALEQNPGLIPAGLDYYRACARRDGLMPQTRALCVRNLKDWARKGGLPLEIAPGEFPESITRLADRIPAD